MLLRLSNRIFHRVFTRAYAGHLASLLLFYSDTGRWPTQTETGRISFGDACRIAALAVRARKLRKLAKDTRPAA